MKNKNKYYKSNFSKPEVSHAKKKNSKKLDLMAIQPKVAIVMGSLTDYEVMKEAEEVFHFFSIPFHIEVVSAHRTPEKMFEFSKNAKLNGFEVIIAAAGGAAHLPGMVASLTTLPVIGVPVTVGGLKGLDALLSIVQMPKGVPVATVAIDNSYNSAILAIRILAGNDKKIEKKLLDFQNTQKLKVKEMNEKVKKK